MTKKRNILIPNLADSDAEKEWVGMPEFIMKDKTPYQTIKIHFKNKKDTKKFAVLINQKITSKTQSLYYPKIQIKKYMNKRYIDES